MHEYRVEIDAYISETILMSRLAEYMQDLTTLFGEKVHVRFVCLEGKGLEDVLHIIKAIDHRLRYHRGPSLLEWQCRDPLRFPRTRSFPSTFERAMPSTSSACDP